MDLHGGLTITPLGHHTNNSTKYHPQIAVVQPSISSAVNRKQKSEMINIDFFFISVYLPFLTVV